MGVKSGCSHDIDGHDWLDSEYELIHIHIHNDKLEYENFIVSRWWICVWGSIFKRRLIL